MRDELVLVVPRETLLSGNRDFQGFTREAGPYLRAAMSEYLFVPRRRAERDERYKQVIPYVVIRAAPVAGREPLYLMFQRAAGGDPRLRRLYSLGLGGHVNTDDVLAAPLIWGVGEAQRQLAAGPRRPSGPASARAGLARAHGGNAGIRGGGAGSGGLTGYGRAWSWPRPGQPSPGAGHPGAGHSGAAGGGPVGSVQHNGRTGGQSSSEQSARMVRSLQLVPDLRATLDPRARTRVYEHPLFRGLRRELREEVSFPAGSQLSLLGAINDDSDPVGRVHFGLTFMLTVPPRRSAARPRLPGDARRGRPVGRVDLLGRKARIRLRNEPGGSVQVGSMLDLQQVWAYAQAMESWSLLLLESGALKQA